MTLSLALLVTMAVLYACGVYLLLERSLTRVLLGFLLIGNATNLLLVIVAGAPGVAPIVGKDGTASAATSDPLPQALILTAIVITFAVSAFLLALIYRSWRIGQRDEVADDTDDIALRREAAESEFADDGDEAPDASEFEDATEDPALLDHGAEHHGHAATHPVDADPGMRP